MLLKVIHTFFKVMCAKFVLVKIINCRKMEVLKNCVRKFLSLLLEKKIKSVNARGCKRSLHFNI